jgi:hypothetical protein
MHLSSDEVRRLDDNASHFNKNDLVMAVFPETTAFYRGVVARAPRQCSSSQWEVIVRFEDDEDETGKPPPRRVPARFVLTRKDVETIASPPRQLKVENHTGKSDKVESKSRHK